MLRKLLSNRASIWEVLFLLLGVNVTWKPHHLPAFVFIFVPMNAKIRDKILAMNFCIKLIKQESQGIRG